MEHVNHLTTHLDCSLVIVRDWWNGFLTLLAIFTALNAAFPSHHILLFITNPHILHCLPHQLMPPPDEITTNAVAHHSTHAFHHPSKMPSILPLEKVNMNAADHRSYHHASLIVSFLSSDAADCSKYHWCPRPPKLSSMFLAHRICHTCRAKGIILSAPGEGIIDHSHCLPKSVIHVARRRYHCRPKTKVSLPPLNEGIPAKVPPIAPPCRHPRKSFPFRPLKLFFMLSPNEGIIYLIPWQRYYWCHLPTEVISIP